MEPLNEIETFLNRHDGFELVRGGTKVRCKLTGHEMPCEITVLEKYVSGKKYQRLTGKGSCSVVQSQKYFQFLQPTSETREKLFCLLTRKTISNTPACIERHVQGKKFKKALEKASLEDSAEPGVDPENMEYMEDKPEKNDINMEITAEEYLDQNGVKDDKKNFEKRKKNQKNQALSGKGHFNADDEGSEEGEEDIDDNTIVIWVPSDHEFEEEEEDPWASYFEHLKPDSPLISQSVTKPSSNEVGKPRKRKSNLQYELSHVG